MYEAGRKREKLKKDENGNSEADGNCGCDEQAGRAVGILAYNRGVCVPMYNKVLNFVCLFILHPYGYKNSLNVFYYLNPSY